MLKALTVAIAAVVALGVQANAQTNEGQSLSKQFCGDWTAERKLDVTKKVFIRADCLSTDFAVEVEFSEDWREGVGQALVYSAVSGRFPGLALVCDLEKFDDAFCLSRRLAAELVMAELVEDYIIWDCNRDQASLAECEAHPQVSGSNKAVETWQAK